MKYKLSLIIILLLAFFAASGYAHSNGSVYNNQALSDMQANKLNNIMFAYLNIPVLKKATVKKTAQPASEFYYNPSGKIPAAISIVKHEANKHAAGNKNAGKNKTGTVNKSKPAAYKNMTYIKGNTEGLPVLTVDYVKKPLWAVLQDVSNRTGFIFSAQGINLGKKVTVNGRYNLAVLLAELFVNAQTTVNIKTNRIKIWQ